MTSIVWRNAEGWGWMQMDDPLGKLWVDAMVGLVVVLVILASPLLIPLVLIGRYLGKWANNE